MIRLLSTIFVIGSILQRCEADWASGVYMLPNQTVPVYASLQTGNIYQVTTTLTLSVANYTLAYGSSLFNVASSTGWISLSSALPTTPTSYQLVIQVSDGTTIRAYAPVSVQVLSLSSTTPTFTNVPNYPATYVNPASYYYVADGTCVSLELTHIHMCPFGLPTQFY